MSKIRDKKAFDVHIRSVKQGMEFCDYDNMDFITTRVIRIKKEKRHRCTSAKERLLREFQELVFLRHKRRHLLDKVLCSSGVVSDMKRYTEIYSTPTTTDRNKNDTLNIVRNRRSILCGGTFTKATINPIKVADVIVQWRIICSHNRSTPSLAFNTSI